VLVLGDLLITAPSLIEAKDLLEVIDDRSQLHSAVVVTQLPVEDWQGRSPPVTNSRRRHPGSTGAQRSTTHTSGQLDAPTPAATAIRRHVTEQMDRQSTIHTGGDPRQIAH
jgi:hypothetical protein